MTSFLYSVCPAYSMFYFKTRVTQIVMKRAYRKSIEMSYVQKNNTHSLPSCISVNKTTHDPMKK